MCRSNTISQNFEHCVIFIWYFARLIKTKILKMFCSHIRNILFKIIIKTFFQKHNKEKQPESGDIKIIDSSDSRQDIV